jgi:deoxyribonuclease-4
VKAAELGGNTFQIFSSSPRMWRAAMPARDAIRRLHKARERLDLYPLAIHAGYLVNLAAADPQVRARSIAAFRGELERAAAIGAEYLVLHPGSRLGQTLEEGITSFARGLHDAAQGLAAGNVTVLLENTVGCGSQMGCRFEELRALRERAAGMTNVPVGYCLDTCHLLAAGYDVATARGLREMAAAMEAELGIDNVKLIHANDSKTPLGSHRDRHANIGEGHIGRAGFRRLLAHPMLRSKPFVLETPVEQKDDDRRNVENLKKLCPKSRTTTTRSS